MKREEKTVLYKANSKYSKQQNSEIRYNLLDAIQTLAPYSGVDLGTIQSTAPWSLVLADIPSQKLSRELKNLIDTGMVVKGIARGQRVRYMLKSNFDKVMEGDDIEEVKEQGFNVFSLSRQEEMEEEGRNCFRISVHPKNEDCEDEW